MAWTSPGEVDAGQVHAARMLVASKALVVTEATAAEVARDLEEVALSVGSAMVVAAEKSSRRLAEVTGLPARDAHKN